MITRIFTITIAATLSLAVPSTPAFTKTTCGMRPLPAADVRVDENAKASYANARLDLPMSWEENRGQFDRRVEFVGRGNGLTFLVSGTETTIEVIGGARDEKGAPTVAAVRMRLEDASANARAAGTDRLPGVVNYIKGEDRAEWHTDVPTYARVVVASTLPGIDMVFHGTRRSPEYDFVVAPGADPDAIRLAFDGATSLGVDGEGNLVVGTPVGAIEHERPFVYQERGGERVRVDGDFEIADGRVGFRLGNYDRSLPLTIDPAVGFSTLCGGDGQEEVQGLAVDTHGNVYFCGSTSSDDYPLLNPIQDNRQGNTDAFVTKMNSRGSALIYSTYFVSDDIDFANAIDVDASGRAAVVGRANYSGWPVMNQYDRHGLFFDADATVAVLNTAGNDVVYCTYIGGRDVDEAFACAWDLHGNLYVAGKTESGNFPTKSPSNLPPKQTNLGGAFDGFICKFDPDESGNTSLVYSTFLGGSGTEIVNGIDVDDFERAYVTGVTGSFNFPTTSPFQPSQGGINDGFVTKYNADGTSVFYSTFLGGNGPDQGNAIAVAKDGSSAVVVGKTDSTTGFPLQNAAQPFPGDNTPNNGKPDVFVTKFNSAGSSLAFSTYLGGANNDFATDVTLDVPGNIYLSGFAAVGFPFANAIPINGVTATTGALFAKLNANGALQIATAVHDNSCQGRGIAVDPVGDVYIAGVTISSTYPTVGDPFQSLKNAFADAFVLKFDLIDDDTIGAVAGPGSPNFKLTSTNIATIADTTVSFGASGDIAIKGDWDGDGDDTIGVYKPATGQFQLRNSNTPGAPDLSFVFGAGNAVPLTGDWDGDGDDTIGIYDTATGTFFLANSNQKTVADLTFTFGPGGAGFVPITGDWEGDGIDTVGIFQTSTRTFLLRSQNAGGNADFTFVFGASGSRPLAGDWNGDGVDTVGAVKSSFTGLTFSLRNSNSAGAADVTQTFGTISDIGIVGNWDGQ